MSLQVSTNASFGASDESMFTAGLQSNHSFSHTQSGFHESIKNGKALTKAETILTNLKHISHLSVMTANTVKCSYSSTYLYQAARRPSYKASLFLLHTQLQDR